MKKIIKKALTLTSALVLCMALAACQIKAVNEDSSSPIIESYSAVSEESSSAKTENSISQDKTAQTQTESSSSISEGTASQANSSESSTVTVPEGHQHLNGKQAQIFARVRKAYSGQEATRQSNVRQLGSAILDSIRQRPVTEWPELGLKLADCVGSDMRFNDFVDLMKGLSENGELTIYSGTGPTAGDIDENVDGLWLCYDDPEGWARVMEVVDAGEDPAEVCAPYLELQASDTANVPQDPNAVPEGEGETAEGEWYPESTEGYYEEAPPAEGYDAAPAEGYGYTEY